MITNGFFGVAFSVGLTNLASLKCTHSHGLGSFNNLWP